MSTETDITMNLASSPVEWSVLYMPWAYFLQDGGSTRRELNSLQILRRWLERKA